MTNTELSYAKNIILGTTEAKAMYIGSTLIWKKIPYDTEITYIESSGTLFIDTGILLFDTSNVNFSIEFKANILGRSEGYSTYGNVINAMYEVSPYPGFVYRVSNESVNTLQLAGTGSIDLLGTVDNVAIRTISANTTASTHNTSTTIFAGYDSNNNPWRFVDMRLYYLKILNHGVLVRDFIPVRVGQIGYLYDKISGLLFGNSGSGSFILGRDKLPTGYTELEYISSTNNGNQYIDLGIKLYDTLNKNYDIAIKFVISSTNSELLATMFNNQDPNNNPWPGTFIRKNNSGNGITGRYIGGTAKDNTIGLLNLIIELPIQTSPNKNVTNLNNNNSTHQYGTSLFCSFSDTSNSPLRYCNGTLYYFKLFIEGVLVRDLIPCKDSNNVVGMYDIVNNVFYTSPNGAAFVAGPEI